MLLAKAIVDFERLRSTENERDVIIYLFVIISTLWFTIYEIDCRLIVLVIILHQKKKTLLLIRWVGSASDKTKTSNFYELPLFQLECEMVSESKEIELRWKGNFMELTFRHISVPHSISLSLGLGDKRKRHRSALSFLSSFLLDDLKQDWIYNVGSLFYVFNSDRCKMFPG